MSFLTLKSQLLGTGANQILQFWFPVDFFMRNQLFFFGKLTKFSKKIVHNFFFHAFGEIWGQITGLLAGNNPLLTTFGPLEPPKILKKFKHTQGRLRNIFSRFSENKIFCCQHFTKNPSSIYEWLPCLKIRTLMKNWFFKNILNFLIFLNICWFVSINLNTTFYAKIYKSVLLLILGSTFSIFCSFFLQPEFTN